MRLGDEILRFAQDDKRGQPQICHPEEAKPTKDLI